MAWLVVPQAMLSTSKLYIAIQDCLSLDHDTIVPPDTIVDFFTKKVERESWGKNMKWQSRVRMWSMEIEGENIMRHERKWTENLEKRSEARK